MTNKTGGPAFPVSSVKGQTGVSYAGAFGMTLIDYFAGQALPAAIQVLENHDGPFTNGDYASMAYQIAEAMLAERKRRGL